MKRTFLEALSFCKILGTALLLILADISEGVERKESSGSLNSLFKPHIAFYEGFANPIVALPGTPDAAITSVTGSTPLCKKATAIYTANGVNLDGGTGVWSSSNTSVASVDQTGLVTAVGAGVCNIVYTITGGVGGTVSASQVLTVTPDASVTSVTGNSPLCKTSTALYTANGVVLGGGTGMWSSSNTAIATVNANTGIVTAVGEGTCNIIYTITGGCNGTVSARQSLIVTPDASVSSVTGSSPLCKNATTTFIANGVVLGGGTGIWSSSNTAVATVNANTGLVSAIGAGTCSIIYTITGGCNVAPSAQQTLTVTPDAAVSSVTGSSPLCRAQTTTYIANGIVLGGGTGTWSSSNKSIADVNPNTGLVTAVGVGTCNIIYTITGGCNGTQSAQQSVTVTPDAAVASVTGGSPLCRTESTTYTANGVVLGGGTGTWSSSNTSVAIVNATSGLVTAVGAGTCNIIFTITGGCNGTPSAQQSLTVTPDAAVVSVSGGTPLCKTTTTTYTANGVVLGGGTGIWSSSNTAVATVNPTTGFVTAVGDGTCNINYTITGGCNGTHSAGQLLTVTPDASVAAVTGVSPLCRTNTTTFTASGVVLGGGTGIWSSSNTAIATVNATSGFVTAIEAGTCDIIYTIVGGCNGMPSARQPLTVTPDLPTATVVGQSPLCETATTTYTVSGAIPGGGTGTWSSSDTSVATVNSTTGLVTGVAAGTCDIIYTITGGCSSQQTLEVTPNSSVTSVTGSTPLCKTSTTTFTANGVVLGGGTGTWSSSNTSVATVNTTSGFVTAVGVGTCDIIFTITGGCNGTPSAQQSLTVTPDASVASVTGSNLLCKTATTTYTANGVVLAGGMGTWSSSNTAIATVNASTGLVTAVGVGTCNIIYTISGGCNGTPSAQQSLTVTPDASVASVTGSSPLCIAATATYTATGVVLGGGTGTWSSSDTSVATVDATTGLVTAVGAGVCNIIYTISGGCNGTPSAQQSLTVTPDASVASVTGSSPLCQTSTATYTATGVVLGGGTGAWSSSNTAVATVNTTSGLVTAVGAGTCDIIYTVTGGCNGTASARQSLTVTPDASVSSVTGSSPLCKTATTTFIANGVVPGGGTGIWSSSNTAVATVDANTGLVTAVGVGTCNIIYTITGGCNGTPVAQQSLTVTPDAAVVSVSGTTPLCKTATTTYTANGIVLGGGTGTWSSSNTAVATVNATTGFVTAVDAGTCNIIYTITGGCNGTPRVQQSLTVLPDASVVSVSGATSLCKATTATYTANGIVLGGGTGSWSSSDTSIATVNATTGLVTAVGAGSCNIIYTITGGCNGTPSAQQTLTVNPTPSLTNFIPVPPSICSSTIFNFSATSSTPGTVLTWSRAMVSGIVQPASSGSGDISEFLTNSTSSPVKVTYKYTLSANGCSNVQNVVVEVNPSPVLSSSLTPPAICSGTTFHYAATSATPGTTFNWSRAGMPGILQSAANGTGDVNETLTNTTNAPIIVNYTYNLAANGCSGSTYNVAVTVNPTPPTPVISPSGPTTFCAGDNVVLSAPSGYSYQWSNGASTQSITISTPGSFSVVVKDAAGCLSAASVAVTTTTLPSASAYAGSDGIICAGSNFTVSGATAANYASLLWTSSGTGTFMSNGTLTPTYVPSASDQSTGTVILTLSAASVAPCVGSVHDDLLLTIQPVPTVNAGIDQSVCYPSPLNISGATATNYQNPHWIHNGSGVLVNAGTLTPTYNPAATDVGNTVTLTLTVDPKAPCHASTSDAMNILVSGVPVNPGVINGPATVCKGTTAVYSIPTIVGAVSYNWALPAGATIVAGANTNDITVSFGAAAASGNLTIYGSNGCGNGVVSTLPIVVNDVPANPGSILGNAAVCQGSTGITYTIAAVPGATNYTWTVPAGAAITAGSGTTSITVDYSLTAANGAVTVFASNSCGSGPTSSQAVTVNVKPNTPLIIANGGSTLFCEGGSVLLTGPTVGYNYLWSPGGITTQTNTVTTSGNYSVVVTDPATGCSSDASNVISVTVNPAPVPPTSSGFLTQCWNGVPPVPILNANTATTVPASSSIVWYDAPTGGNKVALPVLNSIGTITFYAEAKDNTTNCSSLTRTPVTLTINTNPATPLKGSDIIACEMSPIQTLTATTATPPPAGTTILWYTSATGGIPVSPVLSSVGTKTYYAEASNGTCSSLARSEGVKLTIIGAPAPPVSGGDITQCLDQSPQVIVPTATAPAGCTVKWYDASMGGNLLASPSYSGLGTKTFYAESVNTLTNCSSLTRTPVTISVVVHPPAPIPGPDVNECEQSPLQTIVASASVPSGFSVKWYTKAIGGTLVASPSLHAIGVVTYYAETDNSICSSSTRSPVTLRINPAPAPPTSLGNITDCEHLPIQTLTAVASVPSGVTIAWYTTPTGGSPVTSPTLSETGTVTYYAEANSGTCTSLTRSQPIVLTILDTPLAPVSNGDQTECEKSPLQVLTATATAPAGSTVKWFTTASGGTAIDNPTLNKVGTITYYAESDNGNCRSFPNYPRTAVKLQINPAPQVPVSLGNITECEKSPIQTLTAKASAPGSTIAWYTSAVGGQAVPSATLDSVGTVTYYAEAFNGTCVSTKRSAPIVLTINPTPDNPISLGNVTDCLAKPIPVLTAEVQTPPSGVTITWYSAATGGSIVTSPVLKALGTKTYYAEAKLGSCISFGRTAVTLTINNAAPIPKLIGNDTIISCESAPITPLDANAAFSVTPGDSMKWFDMSTGGFEISPILDYVGTKTVYAEERTPSGCPSLKRIPVTLIMLPAPPAPVTTGDIRECAKSPLQTLDASTTIKKVPGLKVVWYNAATGDTIVSNPILQTADSTVTYYAESLDTTTLCRSLIRTAVKLTLSSTSASAASNSPLALGQDLHLKGGPEVTGYSFSWSDPKGFTFSTMDVTIPNITASAAGWYKLTVTDQSGCSSTDSTQVKINMATADYQRPVCIGGTLYLSGGPDNMAAYSWFGPDGFASTEQNPAINNVTVYKTGVYTLTVTDKNGLSSSDTVSVSFKPLPIPIADTNSPVCPGGTLNLNAGPNGMTSYVWTDPGGAQHVGKSYSVPDYNPPAPEKFTLTIVDWNGCEATDTITTTIFRPKASSNSPLCTGDTLRLRGDPNGMASYRWSGPNGFSSNLQSPTLTGATAANATGAYTLTVSDQSGCVSSVTTNVSFNTPPPPATITPNMNPICEGVNLILTGGPSGMTKYEWTGPNGFTSSDQAPQITNVSMANAGKYSLRVTNATGCTSYVETTIVVNGVTFNGTYGPYCISDSPVSFMVSPAGGSFSGPGIVGNTFDPALAGVGSHTIHYSFFNGQCTIDAIKTIDVVTEPKIVTHGLILKSCTGTTADLTQPSVTAGSTQGLLFTYWTDSLASTPVIAPQTVAAGTYYIKGALSGKCYNVKPVVVSPPDSLRASVNVKATDCYGDSTGSMEVTVTMGTAPFTYLWSTQPVQTTSKATGLRAGIYTVIVTDAKMCTKSFTDTIKEANFLKMYFSKNDIDCLTDENGTAQVDSISGGGIITDLSAYKYSWNTVPVQTTRQAVRLMYGYHTVTLTNDKGCGVRDSIFIDVKDTIPPTIQCPKDIDMIVHATKAADGSPNTITVDLGTPITKDNCSVASVTNDAPEKFRLGRTIVTWTVVDQIGLTDTCKQTVYIREFPTIPQLISPNGDGINDKFVIDGLKGFPNSQLLIFTRSGQLVYQSEDYKSDWDGRYQASTWSHNNIVAPGVYYYILTLGGVKQKMQGYVYVYY